MDTGHRGSRLALIHPHNPGGVAQLAEHRLCKAGVESSILFASTRIAPLNAMSRPKP